jgi:hypothetical protein
MGRKAAVDQQVWLRVRHQVWRQVGNQVSNRIWLRVRRQVGNQVSNRIWHQVRHQVRRQVGNPVSMWSLTQSPVWARVCGQAKEDTDG